MAEHLSQFYADLFGDKEGQELQEELPSWIWATWKPEAVDKFRELDGYWAREGLQKLAAQKVGAEDGVVVEMLHSLSEETYDM
eukprot:10438427-Lingulodinium_polyedra.AAC.1